MLGEGVLVPCMWQSVSRVMRWKTRNNEKPDMTYIDWGKDPLFSILILQFTKRANLHLWLFPYLVFLGNSVHDCSSKAKAMRARHLVSHFLLPSYGWNCPGRIFFQKIVIFFATLTAVFRHFLHWFNFFNYFYGSITCATVGKTNFLTLHLRLGTWKKPLNMDDFEVFSHFFPFCTSSYKP